MNIKVMRNIHLYLGVFFAPLLMFFLISGAWQTFNFCDENKATGYKPPAIIKSLSAVHTDQKWADSDTQPSSVPFKWLVLLMSAGLLATTLLGIIMAFKYTKVWVVWLFLLLGIAFPCYFIWAAYR